MAVVFDLGAVVFRWRPEVLLSRVLPHRAPTPQHAGPLVRDFFQEFSGDWGEFDRGTLDVPELVRRMSKRTGLSPDEVERVVLAVPQELEPIPLTVALIEQLREAGHTTYYLSNMPADYATHLERTYPFGTWFRDGVFSSRVRLIKPEPAIYRLAQERLALQPSETLFIDDSPRNVVAARVAGWQALHFTNAEQLAADLRSGGWL
ncbi:HAD family hydrolase [Ideonella sp. BN130291]|uniref:HAD family hydrolase n=1 Tax=Ideonella sp. BN130291 TaxID=3112940 RepID=UPI002E259A98|nr:HAD family phosphatase [Ideonella sp. BN130291]